MVKIYQFKHEEIDSCLDCPCFDNEYGDCNLNGIPASSYITHGGDVYGEIPETCPLEEVDNEDI